MTNRYGIVLVLVVASVVIQIAGRDDDLTRLVIVWLQATTLIFTIRIALASRRIVRLGAVFAAAIAVAAPVVWAVNGSIPVGASATTTALLVALAPPVIAAGLARDLRAAAGVTAEALAGVLAIYLLAGMFFSFLFAAIAGLGDVHFFEQTADPDRADYLYFSYTTLTTTGYGDFTAATDLGRTIAISEALTGQIYLVTVVALIITNLRPRWRDGRRAPPAEAEV